MYTYKAKVTRIVDGDTLDAEVDLGFHMKANLRFRLARIDTPERGQPGFTEATDRVKEICPPGTEVVISTEKAGGFGRWLAEVLVVMPVADGAGSWADQEKNLSDVLLSEGFAELYKK